MKRKYIDAERLRARIEKYLTFDNNIDTAYYIGRRDAERSILELIESLQQEQPAEWSEEDELTIADLINYFEGDSLECSTEEMVQRIKSLRPSWKPREEQIWALDVALENFYHQNDRAALESLRTDLQKLL